jgi:hypothetical protein
LPVELILEQNNALPTVLLVLPLEGLDIVAVLHIIRLVKIPMAEKSKMLSRQAISTNI